MKPRRAQVDVALVHWPILDRAGNIVCTNVTNFDIHDIARASRTFGVERYFIVCKLKEQLSFVSRVLDHWRLGYGAKYNPKRKTALGLVHLAETLDEVVQRQEWSKPPLVVATSARVESQLKRLTWEGLKTQIWEDPDQPVLLVFGTGFGLHEQAFRSCTAMLEPIRGASADDYRHLSVRSAVSICLDRLLGAW